MNNTTKHAAAVRAIEIRCRSLGLPVTRIKEQGGVELEVHGMTAAVRVASKRQHNHTVTVNGKRYHYVYPLTFWNLHQHNWRKAWPDVWFLLSDDALYIVPGEVLGVGLTASLLASKAKYPRRSKIRKYEDAWDVLGVTKEVGKRAA